MGLKEGVKGSLKGLEGDFKGDFRAAEDSVTCALSSACYVSRGTCHFLSLSNFFNGILAQLKLKASRLAYWACPGVSLDLKMGGSWNCRKVWVARNPE